MQRHGSHHSLNVDDIYRENDERKANITRWQKDSTMSVNFIKDRA